MVLKRLKSHRCFSGVSRFFSYTQAGVSEGGHEFENFSKKAVFLISSGKKKFHHFWPLTLEKLLEKSSSDPPGTNLSDAHAHKHVKLHDFCKKLCCITPYGKTVEQHQCGKQAVAG